MTTENELDSTNADDPKPRLGDTPPGLVAFNEAMMDKLDSDMTDESKD